MVTMTHKKLFSAPKIALYEPDIPQNTAAIARTCACLGANLEIIEPCGFLLNDKRINVNECFEFKENTFTIKLENTVSDLRIGQKIIGIKREQPRSYLSSEPAVLRANRNKFSAVEQFNDRADALVMCGHPVDKIEIIILA